MNKILVFLLILLIPISFCSAANITVNGKVGKVIADKPVSDLEFYKVSDKGISDTIMKGRAIVDAHRSRKGESYKTVMTHEDRVATNYTRLMDMRDKLKTWGFKDEGDLIDQSKVADEKAGIKPEGWWK